MPSRNFTMVAALIVIMFVVFCGVWLFGPLIGR